MAIRRYRAATPRFGARSDSPHMHYLEISARFLDDLRRLPARVQERVSTVLNDVLPLEPQPPNLDIKAMKGHRPWLRLRVGDWRIVFRPLTQRELGEIRRREGSFFARGYYVETVVNRREFGRISRKLR
jgi:mRNA-degrading endonuclease RelE of RelBE toxin-antitoxin system